TGGQQRSYGSACLRRTPGFAAKQNYRYVHLFPPLDRPAHVYGRLDMPEDSGLDDPHCHESADRRKRRYACSRETGKNIKITKALFLDTFVASLLLPLSLHY